MKLLAAVLFACGKVTNRSSQTYNKLKTVSVILIVATLALLHSVYGTPVPPANPEAAAANPKPAADPAPKPAENPAANPVPNPTASAPILGPNPNPNEVAKLAPNDELLGTTADPLNPPYRVSLLDANAKDEVPVADRILLPSNGSLPGNAGYLHEAAPSLDAAPNLDDIAADGAADQQPMIV